MDKLDKAIKDGLDKAFPPDGSIKLNPDHRKFAHRMVREEVVALALEEADRVDAEAAAAGAVTAAEIEAVRQNLISANRRLNNVASQMRGTTRDRMEGALGTLSHSLVSLADLVKRAKP